MNCFFLICFSNFFAFVSFNYACNHQIRFLTEEYDHCIFTRFNYWSSTLLYLVILINNWKHILIFIVTVYRSIVAFSVRWNFLFVCYIPGLNILEKFLEFSICSAAALVVRLQLGWKEANTMLFWVIYDRCCTDNPMIGNFSLLVCSTNFLVLCTN